ncbi:MAG: protease pro-enzyme activation domain-containing protein, partial [Bryobacteraceae bacterium]
MRLPHHTAPQVLDGTAIRVGHYNPEQKLRLALFVQRPDPAGEEEFLSELQDNSSPNFHKFLTAAEWTARFGPSVEDEQKIVDWAKSQGLTVTNRYANRMIVDVEAPAGVIEKALGVTINSYQVGDEVDFANDSDPLIPAHLSGVLSSVAGLNSVQRIHGTMPQSSKMKGPDYTPGPPRTAGPSSKGEGDPERAPWKRSSASESGSTAAAASQPAPETSSTTPNDNGISPSYLFSSQAYDYTALYALSKCCNVHNDATGSPADTSIALVTFGDFVGSDVTAFFSYYGMAWNYNTYYIDSDSPPSQDDEADLDVEYSGATANSFGSTNTTAHLYIYELPNGDYSTYADAYNTISSDNYAHVISTSYGGTEATWDTGGFATGTTTGDMHGIFNTMAGEGFTMINAAGDNGATDGCGTTDQVHWPASDPNFVAAGGTELTLYSNGNFYSEVAWTGGTGSKDCGNNSGGGGGGVSSLFSEPSWQNGLAIMGQQNGDPFLIESSSMRLLPDISLEAGGEGQWDYCTTAACQADGADGWDKWGGTSIVAPELAGFFTQVNSYLNSIGHICGSDGTTRCEPIGNPNPILYKEGNTPQTPHYPYYDITSGCNSNLLTEQNDLQYYCAVTGYDEATGWGSANMLQLAWAINWEVMTTKGTPSVSFSGPATGTGNWYNTDQTVSWTVSDSGSGGLPAPGVAGMTQGWDSIPSDSYSKPNGGSGDSFYSGPQFPYGT